MIEVKLDKREKMAHLSEDEKTVLSAKLGQLLWISELSCPSITFEVTDLAGRINTSTVEDLTRLNKIIKKVKSDQASLKFQSLGKNLTIHIFTGASFGNLHDGGSQGGHFIITKGNNQKMNPISWLSGKIKREV